MWIVPASNLSEPELALLGNNLRPAAGRRRRTPSQRASQRVIAAVNRSLAAMDERVARLYRRPGDRNGFAPVPVSAA